MSDLISRYMDTMYMEGFSAGARVVATTPDLEAVASKRESALRVMSRAIDCEDYVSAAYSQGRADACAVALQVAL